MGVMLNPDEEPRGGQSRANPIGSILSRLADPGVILPLHIKEGALRGAGFGVAAAMAGVWFQMLPASFGRIAPSVSGVSFGVVFEVALATALGVVLTPLLRLPLGRLLHLGAIAGAWTAIQISYAIDSPIGNISARYGGLVALVLYGTGFLLSRRARWAGAIAGLVLLGAGVAAPHVYLGLTTPERVVLAELPPAAPGAPDVVLIVLDTVRAESMSAYGYARETTPQFDALAKEGALYLDATSPSTWSLASHASLFTGLFPSTHGAHMEHRYLDEGPTTIAETLASAGYETLTFTANAFITDTIGLTRGFRVADEAWREQGGGANQFTFATRVLDGFGFGPQDKGGDRVASHFEEWAAETSADGPPVFVFLNLIEAHFPYHQLPEEYLHLFSELPRDELRQVSMDVMGSQFGGTAPPQEVAMGPSIDMYDAGIVYTDYLLGRIVDALERRGTLENTVLIVMADHGELVGEHGTYGHGSSVYEPVIRVPLLVRYPPRVPAGARVETPISTVGVYATIVDLLDLESPGPLHVSSLLPAVSGGPAGGPVMAERHMAPVMIAGEGVDPMADTRARLRTYRAGDWKLVESSNGKMMLFDLSTDPGEVRDLAETRPEQVARLRHELDTWQAALGLPSIEGERGYGEVPEIDAGAEERLRALGYVE